MQLREDIKKYGRRLHEKSLTLGRSGNLSVKLDPDTFLINRAGADLSVLQEDELIFCNILQDHWRGGDRPSIEYGFHRSIYLACPDAAAVIHSHPFYSTLISCSESAIRPDLFVESMAYVRNIVRVPYFHAGGQPLAEIIGEKARESAVLLLDNHGLVVWGGNLEECIIKTESFEFLCRMQITAASAGIKLKYLGEDVMKELQNHLKAINQRA
jgi:ribulose-5-phosphate 4-epimerase/fuculose-1-phosphate aldolase